MKQAKVLALHPLKGAVCTVFGSPVVRWGMDGITEGGGGGTFPT